MYVMLTCTLGVYPSSSILHHRVTQPDHTSLVDLLLIFFFFPFQHSAFGFLFYLEMRSSSEANNNFCYPSVVYLTICVKMKGW